ncbi:YiiX/YebB-like N1pC/P60 family cysteine hydrolase [Buttiauxella selenatireducens]|uniref:YiiX/YebB-like N1pC/P60 family cysteine hydrolase n=1 Tax=Buttiauxella selenatireducens TaxID=3073902 RepID=A0ABY9SEK3_9ENTR|nr:YiiX/YebB-like N1pC/P60 family cysteine hydrolase [Buttiauxella sp. R73]WMY75931.1 YiiX/YebB-like N1pC/P60 family cysteine hydrolase [Buttiauxella sp. R73]
MKRSAYARKIKSGKLFWVKAISIFVIALPLCVWGSGLPAGVVSGDLIFRTGDEAISSIIRTMDSTGYSHVGMVYAVNGRVLVIHSTPSEHPGTQDGVVIDSLDFFISKAINRKVFYYQVEASIKKHELAVKKALSYTGTPFSVTTKEGIYCTKLVTKSWEAASVNISTGSKKINIPMFHSSVIMPENIIGSANVKPVVATVY